MIISDLKQLKAYTNTKYIISIDIGLKGFITLLNNNNQVLFSSKILLEEKEKELLTKELKKEKKNNKISFINNLNIIKYLINKHNLNNNNTLIVFEQITIRHFHSSISAFTSGQGYATIENICNILNYNYLIIPPKNWKTYLKLDSDKQNSIDLFNQLINDKKIIINENVKQYFKYKSDDNIEAVLIAYYMFSILN